MVGGGCHEDRLPHCLKLASDLNKHCMHFIESKILLNLRPVFILCNNKKEKKGQYWETLQIKLVHQSLCFQCRVNENKSAPQKGTAEDLQV